MILRKQSAFTTLAMLVAASATAFAATAVPAKIEAESYASMVGVQAETCTEGGQNVGWIDNGDSMTYSITVPTTGSYTIQYRVSSPNATGVLSSSFGGTTLGTVAIPNTGGWQTWQTVSQTVNLTAGTNNLVVSAPTGGWNLNWINVISNGGNTGGGTTVAVPAKIEAEAYTAMVGVALEACGEGTQNVGWIDTGDSMTYSITVPTTGSYTLQFRVASPNATGVIGASYGGTSLGTVAVPSSGGWQTWQTVSLTANLTAGTNNLVISAPTGGWNLNWINVVSNGGNTGSSVTIPAKIEAEAYTSMVGVQTEACSEGTQNVGWIDSGDSMTYVITVPTTGTYTIQYRVASPFAATSLSSSFKGASLGTVSIPQTGGWQTWQTVSQTVNLTAGTGNFVVNVSTGGWNFNWINITSGAPTTVSITSQPVSKTVTAGQTATFNVGATASAGTLAYQWFKNGAAITGANAASYTTPATTTADNNATFFARVSANGVSTDSANATLTVNGSGNGFDYTIYPGFIGTELKNMTNGKYADDQVYVLVIARDPATQKFSWLKPDGTVTTCNPADNDGPGHLTKNGQNYPNYAFTLAQSKLMKLPKMDSGRIFVSYGSPVFIKIIPAADGNIGFAGPNVLNSSDPNIDVNFDWYEFSYNNIGLWINTTQVDQFGFPLDLDVYGNNRTTHNRIALTLNHDQIINQFKAETPAAFQDCISTMGGVTRILAPCKVSFDAGKANGTYFDSYVNEIWSYFGSNTSNALVIDMWNNARRFSGKVINNQFVFTEVNKGNGAYQGGNFYVNKPTTQDILEGKGTLATGNSTESAIEAQLCAAFNRHVVANFSQWATPSAFYTSAPANYYAKFWHDHSEGGLTYGFCYDDVADQSSTVMMVTPEHMVFGLRW